MSCSPSPGGLTLGVDARGTRAALAGRYGGWHWIVWRPFGAQIKGVAVTKADAKRAAEAAAETHPA